MRRITLTATLLMSLVVLAACGTSPGERAVSGAGIGAGAGALGGLMFGNPLAGAAVGGVVGGAVGGLTSPSAIDLGKPVWE
jgi:osmotically inducible lipoprotein OsmB